MPPTFPIGTFVKVRPDTHREGQIGQVVHVKPDARFGVPHGMTVPVIFLDDPPGEDAHLPLWYAPEELIL